MQQSTCLLKLRKLAILILFLSISNFTKVYSQETTNDTLSNVEKEAYRDYQYIIAPNYDLDLQQKNGQSDKSHAADFWLYISFSNSSIVL